MEERSSTAVVFIMLARTLLDVGEARPDAVLVPLQRRKVDSVCKMGGE
ncbi:hypothetical protein [Microbacterium sp. A82]